MNQHERDMANEKDRQAGLGRDQARRDAGRRNDEPRNPDETPRFPSGSNPGNVDGSDRFPADRDLRASDGVTRADDHAFRNADGTARFPVDPDVRSGERNSDGTLKGTPAPQPPFQPALDTSRIENTRKGSKVSLPHERGLTGRVTRVYTNPAGGVDSADIECDQLDSDGTGRKIQRRKVLAGDFKLEA